MATRLERLRLQVVASDAASAIALLVGKNIRAARVEKGLNGRQLAEALKALNPQRAPAAQRVSDWERGVQKPDSDYMKMLSEALERPIAWFYSEHEVETPDLSEVLPAAERPEDDRIGQILEYVKSLDEQVRLLHAELAARDAEALARSGEEQPPTRAPQRRRPA